MKLVPAATLGIGLLALALTTSCASRTTLAIRSDPSQANVLLNQSGTAGVTDQVVELESHLFEDKDFVHDEAVFSKDGYRSQEVSLQLQKGKKNTTNPRIIKLAKLDTHLEFESQPAGARVGLKLTSGDLPPDWPLSFTTPATLVATADEAKALAGNLSIVKIEKEGYFHPTLRLPLQVELKPRTTTRIEIPMRPIVTTLKVITEPPGAVVEDVAEGGFGYLGETPLTRNFNYEDVRLWSNARHYTHNDGAGDAPKKGSFETLQLTLRVSKPGRADAYVRSVQLPVGETRTYHRTLSAVADDISFASDPAGAHVYVKRTITRQALNEETREIDEHSVETMVHLGTTPFTYNIDDADPLRHGEEFVFNKSGYRPKSARFADGQASYHVVMEPVVHQER